ncbi:MAG: class I SAM-dependent methyltransferase [Clostridia bacterium]|nr:class I SAM-dependent methyltransferase [Clostridia bacterium]
MSGYDAISELYDRVNSHVDYEGYAEGVTAYLRDCKIPDGSLVLELGCGTGRMTKLLAGTYDMIGVDNSEGMLSVAMESSPEGVLYLLQDMTDFELYGTVAAATCFLDGMNHLTRPGELERTFRLVHNYLDPDGVFFFDLNTPHKFETEYACRDIIIEDGDDILLWQNDYKKDRRICDFYLTAMMAEEDGRYSRSDTWWRERCYSMRYVRNLLEKCGFADVRFMNESLTAEPDADALRWYVSARAEK